MGALLAAAAVVVAGGFLALWFGGMALIAGWGVGGAWRQTAGRSPGRDDRADGAGRDG